MKSKFPYGDVGAPMGSVRLGGETTLSYVASRGNERFCEGIDIGVEWLFREREFALGSSTNSYEESGMGLVFLLLILSFRGKSDCWFGLCSAAKMSGRCDCSPLRRLLCASIEYGYWGPACWEVALGGWTTPYMLSTGRPWTPPEFNFRVWSGRVELWLKFTTPYALFTGTLYSEDLSFKDWGRFTTP